MRFTDNTRLVLSCLMLSTLLSACTLSQRKQFITYYDEQGSKTFSVEVENGYRTGYYSYWYRNDQEERMCTKFAEDRSRQCKGWHPNGQLAEEINYLGSSRSGPYQAWAPDGTLLVSGAFHNNEAVGTWAYFAPNGKLLSEVQFQEGIAIGQQPAEKPRCPLYEEENVRLVPLTLTRWCNARLSLTAPGTASLR